MRVRRLDVVVTDILEEEAATASFGELLKLRELMKKSKPKCHCRSYLPQDRGVGNSRLRALDIAIVEFRVLERRGRRARGWSLGMWGRSPLHRRNCGWT